MHASLQELAAIFKQLPIKSRKEMEISGTDLLNWFNRRGGQWVGEFLEKVEKAIVSERLKTGKKR